MWSRKNCVLLSLNTGEHPSCYKNTQENSCAHCFLLVWWNHREALFLDNLKHEAGTSALTVLYFKLHVKNYHSQSTMMICDGGIGVYQDHWGGLLSSDFESASLWITFLLYSLSAETSHGGFTWASHQCIHSGNHRRPDQEHSTCKSWFCSALGEKRELPAALKGHSWQFSLWTLL